MKKLICFTLICMLGLSVSLHSQSLPSYLPSNGLVSWWPFNGNANDESGNNNNGVVSGATTTSDRFGNVNSSYLFDGIDDYISISDNSAFSFGTNDFTYSLWFLCNSVPTSCTSTSPYLIGQTDNLTGSNANGYFIGRYCNTNIRFITQDQITFPNNSLVLEPQTTISTSEWYHLTITKSGNEWTLYWNGNPISNITDSRPLSDPISNLIIGNSNIGLANPSHNGKIDDIGIWNRALTQQEITALYQSNTCSVPAYVPTNGLVGYWPFCGSANDGSGNNNNGTVSGATLVNDRFGNINGAYSFDGNGNYITVPNSPSLSFSGDMSFSLWVNTTSIVQNATWLHKYDGPTPFNGFSATQNNGNGRMARWDVGNGNFNQYNFTYTSASGDTVTDGVWHHIVGTFTNYMQMLYVDGILIDTSYNNQNGVGANSLPLMIGIDPYFGSIRNYSGLLDDIGIWNRALTQQEITALYTSQVPCTKPEPVSLGTSASTKLCPNESVTIEIVTPADSANYTYQWTRNGTNMVGATTRSITVNDAAKYKVFVSSGPGVDCRRVSGLVETTPSIPPTIVATAPNGTSYCPGDSVLMTATGATAGYSYRWKRFGVVIPGANSNTFYATQTGNYRCETYNAGGCITQSNLISITNGTSCRIMGENNSDVSVYPNPAQNAFTVSFIDIGNETPVSVELINGSGQIVLSQKLIDKSDVLLNASKVVSGNYRLKIHLESGDVISRQISITH